MTIDVAAAAADKLLTTTRGVRKRMDFSRPVAPEIIRQCAEVAMQAPVGGMEWPTHFIVATEPDVKMRIADLYRKVCDPYLVDLEAKMEAGGDRPKSGVELYRWQGETMHELPALVIVAIEGRFESEPVGMQAAKYGMVLPVAWSFMLALRARGLGSCWTTLHLYEEAAVAKALGMPDNVTQTVLLPVAYYTGDDFRPAKRPPADNFIHWNRWGDHTSPAG
jgi:nitroreductase